MNNQSYPTQKHLNRFIEFRQAVYKHGLMQARDAQFELVDAILLSPWASSFAELSLSPVHRRGWSSAYAALKNGRLDEEYLSELFISHTPDSALEVFSLDGSVWPHPSARTLKGLMYERAGDQSINKSRIVKGHAYSSLAWVPERRSSWALPISTQRITVERNAIQTGIKQVDRLCEPDAVRSPPGLKVIVADGRYGSHLFLKGLQNLPCAAVVRIRRDRVLYGPPGKYSGRGTRKLKHGSRFAFKEPETWHEPDEEVMFEDERYGLVRLRRWDSLHAKQDAEVPFSVIYAQVHLEREKPPRGIWLAYQGPEGYSVQTRWTWYQYRWPIEPAFRFRKQRLWWTLPAFQQTDRCDRWTRLVDIAYWQTFLARELVHDQPLPWQKPQSDLTPGRVLQGIGALFAQIETPARSVQSRGKSPGWSPGRVRTRPQRHSAIKRGKKRAKVA